MRAAILMRACPALQATRKVSSNDDRSPLLSRRGWGQSQQGWRAGSLAAPYSKATGQQVRRTRCSAAASKGCTKHTSRALVAPLAVLIRRCACWPSQRRLSREGAANKAIYHPFLSHIPICHFIHRALCAFSARANETPHHDEELGATKGAHERRWEGCTNRAYAPTPLGRFACRGGNDKRRLDHLLSDIYVGMCTVLDANAAFI